MAPDFSGRPRRRGDRASLTLDKAKITGQLLIGALFYDLTTEKTVTISSQSERRERALQDSPDRGGSDPAGHDPQKRA